MTETQKTINEWQKRNFPDATEGGTLKHIEEEFFEFMYMPGSDKIEEAADLIITLYHWALLKDVDLHAIVDGKMKINRNRTWNIQPDGTGRHT